MSVVLYDTQSRSKKLLECANLFRFYCCGPTVYGRAHIGNFRTFLIQDILRRLLEVEGVNIKHVRNITDVDDKTIRQSQLEGLTLKTFTEKWTQFFHEDCQSLNLLKPHHEPKATEHIDDQIKLIQNLIERGHAYMGKDKSVYFRVKSFETYGQLSHLEDRDLESQSTTSSGKANLVDEYDRDCVCDFALWKAYKSEDGENGWDSPWGRGRPGWHIECSAMAMAYLGETMDLHSGGIDLCFPHHENEIAQSEGSTGKQFVKHWFHIAHLMVDGGKMSKSLRNFYNLTDIQKQGFHPIELRYALIAGHYRQPLNFTLDNLKAAKSALNKLEKAIRRLLAKLGKTEAAFKSYCRLPSCGNATTWSSEDWGSFELVWRDLRNDLNIPTALGVLFKTIKVLDSRHDDSETDLSEGAKQHNTQVIKSRKSKGIEKETLERELKALGRIMFILGLNLFSEKEVPFTDIIDSKNRKMSVPLDVQEWAEARWKAKSQKDFKAADLLREKIQSQGWNVLDTRDGFTLELL